MDHLDTAKSPALDHDGRASAIKTWSSRGSLIEETSLDVAGKPLATTDGYATKKTAYDERDEVTEESLFGADGAPTLGRLVGAARALRRLRPRRGRVVL